LLLTEVTSFVSVLAFSVCVCCQCLAAYPDPWCVCVCVCLSHRSKFQKVIQEIEILKARLASKPASVNLSAAKGNTEQNQAASVNSASHSTITPSGSVCEVNVSHNAPTCIDVANVGWSRVNNAAVVNATPEMPINRDSLSELSLPSFVDCNKQLVVTFMRDIDMYFELKKVPDNLWLPLVLRAIKDPFARNWVSSE
jgi:hypothetical protein